MQALPEPTPLMHATAGAVGGCAALALTYPLQMVTMQLQMHEKQQQDLEAVGMTVDSEEDSSEIGRADSKDSLGHDDSTCEDKLLTPPPSHVTHPKAARLPSRSSSPVMSVRRRGTLAVITRTLRTKDGWRRFYAGLPSALVGQCVIQAVYYYLYSFTQGLAQRLRQKQHLSWTDSTLCASISGAGGAVITNPLWVVSTRQIRTGSKATLLDALIDLAKTEGLSGLFKGLGPALILVANPTIQYGVFEHIKALYLKYRSRHRSSPLSSLEIFLLGAMGKIVATVVTYPYIMAKTTLQSQAKGDDQKKQYETTWACLVGVFKSEGVEGLYRGLNSKMWQSVLTAALLFVLQARCLHLVQRMCRLLVQ